MPALDLQYVVLFIAFVLPGAISIYVYSIKIPQPDRNLKDRIVEAIAFSTINFVLLFWFIQFLFRPAFIAEHPFYSWLLVIGCFVVAPALWPFLIVKNLRWLAKREWILVQAPTAWDFFFSQATGGCWIIVDLADGSRIGGKFGRNSYASAYPNFGHLYVEELWDVNSDGTFGDRLAGRPGVLLRPNDYRYVKVFKEQANGGQ